MASTVFKRELSRPTWCENQIVIGRESGVVFLSQSTEELITTEAALIIICQGNALCLGKWYENVYMKYKCTYCPLEMK